MGRTGGKAVRLTGYFDNVPARLSRVASWGKQGGYVKIPKDLVGQQVLVVPIDEVRKIAPPVISDAPAEADA